MRFMSKRQYTKSPDLRQAKVGIGGCFGEAQWGIVLKKRGSDNNLTEGGAARPPRTGRAQRGGTLSLSGSEKRIVFFRLSVCRTAYFPPFTFDALCALRRRR